MDQEGSACITKTQAIIYILIVLVYIKSLSASKLEFIQPTVWLPLQMLLVMQLL